MKTKHTLGIITILIGVLWLLANFSLIVLPTIWSLLPIGLITLGFWQLVASNFANKTTPIILIVIGTVMGLLQINIITWTIIQQVFWPAILIYIGITLFTSHTTYRNGDNTNDEGKSFNIITLFGSDKKYIPTQHFEGGEIIAIFGDCSIDLSQANVSHKPSVINVFSLFSEVKIELPDSWYVSNSTTSIFADILDRRSQSKVSSHTTSPDTIIEGVAIFSDITLRD